ncbi:MAG: TonB-dependent receptor [Methylophilaceae bacterium]|jgi:outer membrane receptor protein involved in Fe transport|nr:TonB-dependent receptor [Methyloradius sp.]
MQHTSIFRAKLITVLVASTLGASMNVVADDTTSNQAGNDAIKIKRIDIISTTPLPSLGLPIEQIPSNVQTVKAPEMERQQSLSLADYLNNNIAGVNVNDTQNNPFQPDVNYHGFTASPLLGTPQGLSVYQDGVRVNEPFGDVVNWDLIPKNAIAGITLMPGSNPVFGLNTLGGALSVQTKSGLDSPGFHAQAYGGSWGRRAVEAEAGGKIDNGAHWFVAGNAFKEDGWRDASPSDVRQLFGKFGWAGEKADFEVAYTGADNKLVGNGYQPEALLDTLDRSSIYTKPDQTKNQFNMLTAKAGYWVSDQTYVSSNVYYRKNRTSTLNGDLNDDYDPAGAGNDLLAGVNNRTKTNQDAFGAALQASFKGDLAGHANQVTTGATYDHGRIKFGQTAEFGGLTADRGVTGNGVVDQIIDLKGKTTTYGIFATDTFSLTDRAAITASGRYNHTRVKNDDLILPSGGGSLTGEQSFQRFNPALGATYSLTKSLNLYGGYNEGSRAPSSIEIACSDPAFPCQLPNSMAGDPPTLKQVVAKTWEGGLRGSFSKGLTWSMGAYRTKSQDDIQFIASSTTGAGYFQNVGDTRRQGIDFGIQAKFDKVRWSLGYSFIDATYQTPFQIANEVNSASFNNGSADVIQVNKGNYLAGIPKHQLKLRTEYDVSSNWVIGSNIMAYSSQFMRGNENNADPEGRVSGFALLNLDTRYTFGNSGWNVFAKVNNVFDREYANGGILGRNAFSGANGAFDAGNESDDWQKARFLAPGAPRAAWVGVAFDFDRPKSARKTETD